MAHQWRKPAVAPDFSPQGNRAIGAPASTASPPTPSLRPYQQGCLEALTEAAAAGRSSLGVMPTGSGRRGGTRAPVDINDAVRQAHMLRRPPAVLANDNNGFVSAIPVWD
jgi:hypothetical protein